MKLFLASEAKNPESVPKMEKFIGGFEGKSAAYIPTAANGEGYGSWHDSRSLKLAREVFQTVEVVEIERYKEIDIFEMLSGKDVIWVAGGSASFLAYWLIRSGLNERIKEYLEKGAYYVGSSAGSMITTKDQTLSTWYIGEEEKGADLLPGLDLVDFSIYPHYKDEYLEEIKKYSGSTKIYLLKDGEAITVVDGEVRVLGEERII
ncbi:MAG TPA: Type 1 glutamine amidotransferase-like domain-containing protein [Candidatus Dojkabacteria bacterium]